MPRPTPLKLAIFTSELTQKEVAAKIGMSESAFSRIVNGLHCDDDLKQQIADTLGRTIEDLWPNDSQMAA